jgi:rSAM/selenodomain-associated transferase 1
MTRSVVLVFAKLPKPGRVKTRLLGAMAPEQAAEVHRRCLEDTLALVSRVPRCQKYLRVAARPGQARALANLLGLDQRWRVDVQRGRNLGERLHEALDSFWKQGYRKVVVVGTDTPWMGRRRIVQALRLLKTADVVLGPTADGGYYLAGVRRVIAEMFQRIPWGTSQVFRMTLRALKKEGASYRLLPLDFDLDRPEDLEQAAKLLRCNPERAPSLARWLNQLKRDSVSRSSRRQSPAHRNRRRRLGRE